ncbi:MAG TPA: hypothetical protein VN442_25790 [Bryobacteraceae bacterium]|nr:hypothetical protein [Bryobacteraceae bacterium]
MSDEYLVLQLTSKAPSIRHIRRDLLEVARCLKKHELIQSKDRAALPVTGISVFITYGTYWEYKIDVLGRVTAGDVVKVAALLVGLTLAGVGVASLVK